MVLPNDGLVVSWFFLDKFRNHFAGMLNTSRRNFRRLAAVDMFVKRPESGIPSLNEISKPEEDYHPSKYTILG